MGHPSLLTLERATIHCWPARLIEQRHGWQLLATRGATRRVNATWPLEWHGGDVERGIDDVEQWYAGRRLPTVFKVTDGAVAPTDLAGRLAARGYVQVVHALTMSRPLLGIAHRDDAGVALFDDPPPAFDAALAASTPDAHELAERSEVAARAPAPRAFAVARHQGADAAVGMASLCGDLAGIFAMRTHPDARRRGLARRVLAALLQRASELGAVHAYLQVEAENPTAIALYESEGFVERTRYSFWVRSAI